MALEEVSSWRSFNGYQKVFKHKSETLQCEMRFGVYVPDHEPDEKLHAVFYLSGNLHPFLQQLSGLTCTEANVMEKSGFQRVASRLRLLVLHPDTSPRGVTIEGDRDNWDFGQGAGFYVDATKTPWSTNYRMASYVEKELPSLLLANFPAQAPFGLFGHSMGGHGALTIGLRNPDLFVSLSAFAPICHPMACPWGRKAFSGYLGENEDEWKKYDASLLVSSYAGPRRVLLIDVGGADSFLAQGQLQPESLVSTNCVGVKLRVREKFDHSYYFVASFMEEHLEHHAALLSAAHP